MEQRVIPTLRITDYLKSKEFYVDGLGFKIDWEHRFEPDLPVFLQLNRDGLTLYLSQHAGDCQVGGLVHFYVPDVDGWHAEFTQKGVPVRQPPTDEPWGLRDMTVVDPDGNQLRICTRKEPAAPSGPPPPAAPAAGGSPPAGPPATGLSASGPASATPPAAGPPPATPPKP